MTSNSGEYELTWKVSETETSYRIVDKQEAIDSIAENLKKEPTISELRTRRLIEPSEKSTLTITW